MTRGRRLLCLAAVLVAVGEVHAGPLDAEGCAKLTGEQTQLELAGVPLNMEKGPQWAKANLAPDKIEQIRRLIEVEEQLLFRCRGRSLVKLPPEPEPDPAATSDASKDAKESLSSKAAAAPPGADKKATGPAAEKKKADAVKKAAKQPANKQAAGQTKQGEAAKTKAPAKAAATAKKPAENSAQPPLAKATVKPKPKAKADDAYKGPQPDPAVNPFAKQLAPPAKQ